MQINTDKNPNKNPRNAPYPQNTKNPKTINFLKHAESAPMNAARYANRIKIILYLPDF